MHFRFCVIGIVAVLASIIGWRMPMGSASPAADKPVTKTEAIAPFAKDVLPFLTKHCFACHGNGKHKGDLALDKYKDASAVHKDRKVWDSIVQMVKTGEMPPDGRPRPSAVEIEKALAAIDSTLAQFDCTGPRPIGRVTIRRLNRNEYNHTIRDLVGIDFRPAADFPNDDVGYGFDNIGDVLTLSPLLLEKYLLAAETVVDRAIVIADPPKPMLRKVGRSALRPSRGAGDVIRGVGVYLHSRGEISMQNTLDEGDYTIKIRVYGRQVGPEPVRMALRVNGKDTKVVDVRADNSAKAETVEIRTRLKGGPTRIAAAFLNPYTDPDEKDPKKRQRQLLVNHEVEIDGPYDPPPPKLPDSHKKLLAHQPNLSPREAAREVLARFAYRAFRRPLQDTEVEHLLKLYDLAAKDNERWENAMRLALEGVLVSPHFLFRIESDPPQVHPGAKYAISDYELASRLSYFLWSSMPDDELLQRAKEGKLRGELEAQVRRMLQDKKSTAFVQSFAGQWLTLRNLQNVQPDAKTFPNFDEELRTAMNRETELVFEAILREDRSILDFIDADFSFVNSRLAKHYGIPNIYGREFKRVKLPAERGGILTHASILTLTSNPTRTSPVKRGKWVLEQLLGTPPPPPPPDVPELNEDAKAQLTGSLRQRLEQHRSKPSCAICHNRLDPLGFAFENYDAIGAWRTQDGSFDIDPSGVLPDGKAFKSAGELKTILKGQKEQFARCLTEKLLTYALGRGLEYYDKCTVDDVVKSLAQQQYRFSTLIMEVIKSEPFTMQTARAAK